MTEPPKGPVALAWEGGDRGAIVSISNDGAVTARSSRAFAPGSRPCGTLATGDPFRMKTHRCRREAREDGMTFTIEGRALDLTRELASRITAMLTATEG